MLVESGDRLAFRHDVTREAVRESVPVSARRALDRQAADMLLAAGATPVEVAAQIAASAEPGDEQAISILLRAGEALATTDPGAGADLSRRALELAPRDHALRGPLLAQTAVLLHSAGRVDEARAFADTQSARRAAGRAGGRGAPRHRGHVPRPARRAGRRGPPGARVARAARAPARPATSPRSFTTCSSAAAREEAKAIRAETAAAVQASGDANSAFAFTLAETVTAYVDGRYQDALEMTEQAAQRRHRHDRLGARAPRPGVALRDAHRAGPRR